MSKKTKDETIDLLYSNNNQNNKSKKNSNKAKNKNVPQKQGNKKDIIDLDNEIIIGLTPKQPIKQPKKQAKNGVTNKTKSKSKRKNEKRNINKKPKDAKKIKRRIRILKWTSIVMVLIGSVVLFMLSPIFNVKQINVEGIQKLTKEEVVNLSQIKIDENTFKIKGVDVIERIQSNNYVETVNIKRELPSNIKIVVKERVPQYIIEIANGNAYIDSKGYILEISTEKIQVPVLKGYVSTNESIIDFQNTKKLLDEDCKKIQRINQIYDSAKNNDVLKYITSIDITDMDNITLNLDSEKKVAYFGDASNANLRILYLKKMIDEEAGKEGEAFINGYVNTAKPKPYPYFRERV